MNFTEDHIISSAALLPTELLLTIMEYAWNRKRGDQVTLAHCSLVCSKWRPIAQRLLFTEVTLRDEPDAKTFLQAIQEPTALGGATKILTLEESTMLSYEWQPHSFRSWLVWDITKLCPNLYHLDLQFATDFDVSLLSTILHPHTFNTLQSLSLTFPDPGYSEPTRVSLHDIRPLLQQFSGLTNLRIEAAYALWDTDSSASPPWTPPPSFELYKLGWINTGHDKYLENDSLNQLTDWLFGGSRGGPYIFDLVEDPYDQVQFLEHFIEKHGENLVSLHSSIDAWKLDRTTLHRFPTTRRSLKELCIPFAEICRRLPEISTLDFPHLQHLQIKGHATDIDSNMALIEWVNSLPKIRCVSLCFLPTEFDSNHPLIQLWKERCSNAVELRIFSSLDFEEDDPIRTNHFPRGRTIENLYRMTVPST
ncbi:hypothetical protein FRC03_011748 [Tulasnella sp. 419]|nr:hypothetical protein FRC03_011748 [Tulasnella sp. 419]